MAPAALSISIANLVITLVSREIYTPRRGLSGEAAGVPASTGIDIEQHIYLLLSYTYLSPSRMASLVPLTMAITVGSYTAGVQRMGLVIRKS
jgi:hypothetical protein